MPTVNQLLGLPIVSRGSQTKIGEVKDLYFDQDLQRVVGIFTHAEGLIIHHSQTIIEDESVVRIEKDRVVVHDKSVEKKVDHEPARWLRRDIFVGRPVQKEDGSDIGSVEDVVVSDDGKVTSILVDTGDANEAMRDFGRTVVLDVGLVDGIVRVDVK